MDLLSFLSFLSLSLSPSVSVSYSAILHVSLSHRLGELANRYMYIVPLLDAFREIIGLLIIMILRFF